MDVVASLLEGPRAHDAFLIRTHMAAPWALRIEDRAALTVVVILHGSATLSHTALDGPERLDAGDLILVQGPDPYVLGDRAQTSPRFRILPGNRPVTMTGEEIGQSMNLGVRTWGSADDEAGPTTRMLTGIYADSGEASRRLLDALDPVTVRRGAARESTYVDLLATESLNDAPGQSAVLDRLLDLVLIDTVRRHFADRPDRAPRWYTALDDEVVGRALRAVHADPAAPWSVAGLASTANLSRAAFSRRFASAVGDAPMSYVKRWRLSLAADHLADADTAIGVVAGLVGYDSAFTFSAAFKAHFGTSPSAYRNSIRSAREPVGSTESLGDDRRRPRP